MTRRNRHITLEETAPGMVLSEDVFDQQGQVLLSAGAVLSEICIASLRQHHVDTVPILGRDVSEADDAAELAQSEQRLASLFRKHSATEGATEMLRQSIYRFRLGTPS